MDIGCGHKVLHSSRFNDERRLVERASCSVGLDSQWNSLRGHHTLRNRICGDIDRLPFKSDTFDIISANMVFEHLSKPGEQLKEIFRVLRPTGKLFFHTPNALGYTTILARLTPEFLKAKLVYFLQGRKEKDVFPAYYQINTVKTIRILAEQLGFNVGYIATVCNGAQSVMIPPLAIIELIWIRLLMTRYMRNFRNCIVAELRK